MNSEVLRAVGYRFRATFAQRRGGYVAIVVLLALVGGVALGALAGARRTQTSFPTYLASTNPSDLQTFDAFVNPALGFTNGYNPSTGQRLARLRYVRDVATIVGFDANIDTISGAHLVVGPGDKPPSLEGTLGAEDTTEDRVTLVAGRLANPTDAGEAVMNAQAEEELGIHLGSVLRVSLESNAQLLSNANNPPPVKVVSLRLVGLVVFPTDVLDDDYAAKGSADVLMTPALTREIDSCCATYSYSALQLVGGVRHLTAVESEVVPIIGRQLIAAGGFRTYGPSEGIADQSVGPEAIALAVFGGLAALAVLVIVGQVIGRQLRRYGDESEALRALGAGPIVTMADGIGGALAAVVVGSLLAIVVAVALSPLFPLGPVRPVYPSAVGFDWTVLGFGFLILVVVLGAVSVLLAYLQGPHRIRQRERIARTSGVARVAAASGLPVPAVTGIRFALEPGGAGDAVPVRSAIVGAVLAVLVLVATVTFGASLNALISQPRLYGWNWNYALLSGFSGDEDLPAHLTATLLARDYYVVASSGVYFSSAVIDGQRDIPVIGATPNAVVQPPVLTGSDLEASNQIVLGVSTMAALHAHVGGTVTVDAGQGHSARLVVAGTATMPALMGPGLGIGAVVDYRLIPASVRNAQRSTIPGPQAYFIRTRGGTSADALGSLQSLTRTINAEDSDGPAGGAIPALRPVEIVASGSIETIPTVLGAGLAAGAVAALGITLVASVRRRRGDLAVMKTLGLSGRQLATVIAWQASVAVTIGALVGVPLGIVVGRSLWDLFATSIHAVPVPSVPVLTLAAIIVGAILVANVVAALPGRIAARTPTALLLRVE